MAATYLSGGRTLIGVILPSRYHHEDLEPTSTTTTTSSSTTTSLHMTDTSSKDRPTDNTLLQPCRGSPTMSSWKCHAEEHEEEKILTLRRRTLSNAALAQTIQARIPSYNSLVELDVSRNSLTDLPQVLLSLPNLRTLNASGNQLVSIPLVLYHMHLRTLDLSDNEIRDVPSHFPPASPHLEVLYLDGNVIQSLPSTISTAWTHLTSLRLGTDNACVGCRNQITRLPDLESMTALVELEVSYNLLESLPPMPPNLRHLHASHNRLTTLDERVLRPCRHSLETLHLANNLLLELPHELVHLDRLQMLDVTHNRLLHFPADLLEQSQASPTMTASSLNILFTGNPVIHGNHAELSSHFNDDGSSTPPLINSLHELALRSILQLDKRARSQDLPEHLIQQLTGEIGRCAACKGPFVDEYKKRVQVKQYRGHPSVAREVRYCSTQCSQTHAMRIREAMRQRRLRQQQRQPPFAFPMPTAARGWSLEWIVAAASAAAEQTADDEDDGYLVGS